MCGIAGVIGNCSSDLIDQMLSKMSHRGPDNISTISIGETHLAHARLSIIDLSSVSNQPLWDINKQACIVFNGEIYNYKELRNDLLALGYIFTSEGDAEVILNLYLEYGVDCLLQLNGIFAFSIWDVRSQELFVARDPFGVKPLYYSQNTEGFYFASELKSLLVHPSISRELNSDALLRTIVFLWSPGPETIIKNIFKLEPGQYLIVKNRKIVKHQSYYTWPKYAPNNSSIDEICNELQESLKESVKAQLVSDVPVGAFLSGGLDSSLIVAIAKEQGVQQLDCFTIDSVRPEDNNDGFVNDLPYAKRVAKYLNLPLNILKVDSDIVNLLNKMLYHLDEPQADPAPLNVLLICEEARKCGIKVLFSGAGGDDLFTGYRRHLAVYYEKLWCWLPTWARKFIQFYSRKLKKNKPILRRLSKIFNYTSLAENERILSYFYWIDPDIVRNLFTDKIQNLLTDNPMQSMLDELDAYAGQNAVEKMLSIERRYFLADHNFNYTDKMAMAHGVEVRVPFLDKGVVNVAAGIKTSIKQRGFVGKWILKKMAERYLPKSIVYRSKSGFGAPLQRWMKKDLKFLLDDTLGEESIRKRGLFKFEEVQKLRDKNSNGEEYYDYPLFALVCIELWCRIFIDQSIQEEAVKSLNIEFA